MKEEGGWRMLRVSCEACLRRCKQQPAELRSADGQECPSRTNLPPHSSRVHIHWLKPEALKPELYSNSTLHNGSLPSEW